MTRHAGMITTIRARSSGGRILAFAVLAAFICAGLAGRRVVAADGSARVSLSRDSGPAGAAIMLSARGFPAGGPGQVRWADGDAEITPVTVDASGAVEATIAVPNLPPGTYAVSMEASGVTARAAFTITGGPAARFDGGVAMPDENAVAAGARRVVAYFPLWLRNGGYSENDIDFSIVTHVAHFSVSPRADGSIDIPDWGLFPDTRLITKAHAAGAKVVLTVGGDHAEATAGFAAMSANGRTRARFVHDLTALISANGYDGVDLDWEFPQNAADRANFTALVRDLRGALGRDTSLSIAGPASDWYGRWLDIPALLPNLDWIGAMTYSLAAPSWSERSGHNAPLFPPAGNGAADSVDASRAYYLSRGVPPSKLLVGLPFFGERFDGASAINQPLTSKTGAALDYREVAPLVGNDWMVKRDASAEVPYLVRQSGPGIISYDDADSIAAKCSYIVDEGLGGAIVWHLGKDQIGSAQPLLKAARGCR